MTQDRWFVSQDGVQLQGEHERAQVARLLAERPGAAFLVWKEGMAQWADPRALPEFAPPPSAPAPAPAAAAPPRPYPHSPRPAPPAEGPAGFFKALFDFRFEQFITPRIIGVVYALAMVLIGLGALFLVWSGLRSIYSGVRYDMGGLAVRGLIYLVLAPVLSLLYLAMVRVFLEGVLVLFKIKDNTAKK
jgi:hypothetical protein